MTRRRPVTPADVEARRPLLEATHRLLSATAARPASFGCFGMHEWAMVHRSAEHGTRHGSWPLRLGADGTDAVVESHRIACSHFDAFRFFTPSARPLNTLSPAPPTGPTSSSPAACTPAWTSTSTRSGSGRWCSRSWWPTASSSPARSGCSTCARRRTT